MQESYWRRVHRVAFAKTCDDLGLETRRKFVIKAILTLALIGVLTLWGYNDLSRDEIVVQSAVAGIVILVFPAFYVANFLATPPALARQDAQEAEERIKALAENTSLPNAVVRSLADTQDHADELNQRLTLLAALFRQYQRLLEACFNLAEFRGVDLGEYDIDIVTDFLSAEVKAILPALPLAPAEPLVFATGWNRYRYIFSVPKRIPPRVEFPDMPSGVSANVIRTSKIDFEVEFFDQPSLNRKHVDPQSFTADAEL